MWTEERIRQYLDGTFTYVRADGSIGTSDVETDFIPRHIGLKRERERIAPVKPWQPAEDQTLKELRRRKFTIPQIAVLLDRTDESVKARLRLFGKWARKGCA